jgi:hypothetical protein
MNKTEHALMSMVSEGLGTRTFLGGTGAVKERIRAQGTSSAHPGSCGGTTGGWGNAPESGPIAGSCGGVGGGWGNSPY